MLGDSDPISQLHPETPTADQKLPDALRAFRELLLKLTSDGNLTVAAAESVLKTLNICLEKDLLRCGPESDPSEFICYLILSMRFKYIETQRIDCR
jgi:hypothetical protein